MSSMTPFSTWYTGERFELLCGQYDMAISMSEDGAEMLWMDLESTGLDPLGDPILELGFVLTDRWGSLIENGAARWLVMDPRDWQAMHKLHNLPDVVFDMHTESGLLSELANAVKDPRDLEIAPAKVQNSALWWLRKVLGDEKYAAWTNQIPMSGSSVHFDRAHLKVQMRSLHDWFHYRNGADVSGIRYVMNMHDPEAKAGEPEAKKLHRVIPDLLDSITLYRHQLANGFILRPEVSNASAA